jgi:hypothetical protein
MPVFTDEGMHASPMDDWSKEVERGVLNEELGQMIRKYTEELSEKYRVVFVLSDVEGLVSTSPAHSSKSYSGGSLAAFFSILIAQLSTLSFKSTPRHPPSLILNCRMIQRWLRPGYHR